MSDLIFAGAVGLEGLVNARDIGGWPAGPGRRSRVRTGQLYRSETPELMTPADVARVIDELGVTRVIDLRGARSPGSGPLGANGRGIVLDFIELVGGFDSIRHDADGFLPGLLDRGGRAVGAVLAEVVATSGASWLHCHTGKDRTGFVVALILAHLGVADGDIIADYERSIPAFAPMMANLVAAGRGVPREAAQFARDAPSRAGIRALLGLLRSGWESPTAYLREQGVDAGLLEEVADLLLEPAV